MSNYTSLIEKMLDSRRIAVVGISADAFRPSHAIARYLIEAGYEVAAVNPNLTQVLDRPCYASLSDVPGRIDLVNIFRRAEFIPMLVTEALAVHAGGVWVQSGIRSAAAVALAAAGGIDYVEDRCIMVEISRRGRDPTS